MRTRQSFAVSAAVHALLLGALAVADDWLIEPPSFAVRPGYAVSMHSVASRANTAPVIFDSRIEAPTTPPIEIAPSQPEPAPAPPAPSPTSADLDHRPVHRSGDVVVEKRRAEHGYRVADVLGSREPTEREDVSESPIEIDVPAFSSESAVVANMPEPERLEAATVASTVTFRAVVVGDVIQEGDSNVNSIAANQSAGAQVDHLPTMLPVNPQPVYPDALRRRQIGGQVMLRVAIGTDGRVERVQIEKSSGHRELDESAEAAVRKWQFAPARKANRPVRFEVRLPITFSIRRG